jgi:Bacterial regulatory protein, Fis family
MTYAQLMAQAEEKVIRDALACYGTVTQAAAELNIHRNTMSRKVIGFGITKDELTWYRRQHIWHHFGRNLDARVRGRKSLHSL